MMQGRCTVCVGLGPKACMHAACMISLFPCRQRKPAGSATSVMIAGMEAQAVTEGTEGQESEARRGPKLPELPYHRFSNGDGILLVSTLPNGELPKPNPSQARKSHSAFILHLYSEVKPLLFWMSVLS